MRYKPLFIGFVFLFIAGNVDGIAAENDLPALIEQVKSAVVTIIVYNEDDEVVSQGSGFFIGKNRLVTNRHVMAGGDYAEYKLISGGTFSIKGFLDSDNENDLVLLYADTPPKLVKVLGMAMTLPKVGQEIVVVGSPLGLDQTISNGIVSSIRELPGFGDLIQITAPISSGSSGGPVIDKDGKVVGIVVSQVSAGQNLNFAVPSKHISNLRIGKLQLLSVLKKSNDSIIYSSDYSLHALELLIEEQSEYRSKWHTKAQGLDISLKYPASWLAKEGDHPHIVQKFTESVSSEITLSCMIAVNEIPAWASYFLQGEIVEEIFSEGLQEMIPPGAVFIDGGQTKLDGEPCVWQQYYYEQERLGMHISSYILQYTIFYGGKGLSVSCGISGVEHDRALLKDAFSSYQPVFQTILNSIVIHDKWNQPVSGSFSSVMEDAFGEFWWITIFVSALMTWGIGLTPPLLIRFLFFRRPISKIASIGIVVPFWFINIIIFIALGSESKTHTALLLVAFASYAILHRGYTKSVLCLDAESPGSDSNQPNPISEKDIKDQCSESNQSLATGRDTMRIQVKPKYQPPQNMSLEEANAMLERGELNGDEQACHLDLSDWTVLREIEGIDIPAPSPLPTDLSSDLSGGEFAPPPHREFSPSSARPPVPAVEPKEVDHSKTKGANYHPWRRLFARTVDVTVFGLVFLFFAFFSIGALFPENASNFEDAIENPIVGAVFIYMFWIPLEAMFLAVHGTTPAKWLFGIRVLDPLGNPLSFWASLQRTFLVSIVGDGLCIPFVTPPTRLFSYFHLKSTGTTFWDNSVNSVVSHCRWDIFRAFCCVIIVLAVFMFLGYLENQY